MIRVLVLLLGWAAAAAVLPLIVWGAGGDSTDVAFAAYVSGILALLALLVAVEASAELSYDDAIPETEELSMELKERIEQVKAATGYVEEEEAVEEAHGFTYGERVRVIEDDEEEGVFSGDGGLVLPCKVGAAEHHNERVMLAFLADGMASPVEVQPDAIEAA